MIVLAVNDKIENYIEVSLDEAKEKYNYKEIIDDGSIENEV